MSNMSAAQTSPQQHPLPWPSEGGGGGLEPQEFSFTKDRYINILNSMGHAVYVFNLDCILIYWNRPAELLFGYSAAEALGCHVLYLLADATEIDAGFMIIARVSEGNTWTGLFPITHRRGGKILLYLTVSPFYDDTGTLVGTVSLACDSRPFEGPWPAIKADATCSERDSAFGDSRSINAEKHVLDPPHQPLQVASRILNLAYKVGNKMKSRLRKGKHAIGESQIRYMEDSYSSGSTIIGISPLSSFEVFPKANSSCSAGSCSFVNLGGTDSDNFDHQILWEDLTLGQQIGQGSSGTVYHATWFGSDVTVKVFSMQDFSDEVIFSFRQEVSLLKRLEHLNVLVLLGAVTSPQRLCIVNEFFPRGSLFRVIQRNVSKLDWRRRTLMALDIAQGMNFLHHHNPPIVHGNLKSSNLLVDKNWTVKVSDFGLSSFKHETFRTTKSNGATAQWKAPEVLRNKTPDEKSDVYSFGVILWELATRRIPWDNLNAKQITGLVGFLNRRLEIPEDVDPLWASVIESCWREPEDRPTFRELMEELKGMLKKYSSVQFQAEEKS